MSNIRRILDKAAVECYNCGYQFLHPGDVERIPDFCPECFEDLRAERRGAGGP